MWHTAKTTETPNLLKHFNGLVVILVFKAVLMLHCENYVWDKQDYYKHKSRQVKSFHFQFISSRAAPFAPFPVTEMV